MSESTAVIYTSQTGVEPAPVPNIEHVVSARVRMTDSTYGLKTAAKTVHDKFAREKFLRDRDAAIARQREREQAKLTARIIALDEEIGRIRASLISATCSDKTKATTLLHTLEAKRARLVQ